ncbi:cytochrome P450 [Streptomyces clavuligerus]|uniref:cytochrome P450 n=1 Tax=Streptomyces clavuligerus TaxID=1901 RepID=UPI00237835D2|nr:cytochrome P450 [Streptomyces clavuligerus]
MSFPSSSVDLLDERVLADPCPVYAALRAVGPVVRLARHHAWAITRHRAVEEALTTGILTPRPADSSTPACPGHHPRPEPAAVRAVQAVLRQAREVLAGHTHAGVTDAAAAARHLTARTVLALAGTPRPAPLRLPARKPVTAALAALLHPTPPPTRLKARPDGPGKGLSPVVRCALAHADVTAAGLTETLWQLAHHPDQWTRVRAQPSRLAPAALHEALRLQPPQPHQVFTTAATVLLSGVEVAAGDEVWLLHRAAGRDPAQWGPTADGFDIHRPRTNPRLPGSHCPTATALARAQTTTLLQALAAHPYLAPAAAPVRTHTTTQHTWLFAPLTTNPATGHNPHGLPAS